MKIDWTHIFCLLVCRLSLGMVHIRSEWKSDGIHCEDCHFFKSRAEHQADLHAGGGW